VGEGLGADVASVPSCFISYDRGDEVYARRLTAHLQESGLPYWWDLECLSWGERFPPRIAAEIRRAVAMIVIMSPAAERSRWVEREILEGQRHDREFLPILLSGDRFFLLAASNYFDARRGDLPGEREMRQLARLVEASGDHGLTPSLRLESQAGGRGTAARREDAGESLPKLRALIDEGRLDLADILTTSILLEAVGRTENGWLRQADGRHIPFGLLDQIDSAWSASRLGTYGFRAQLRLHASQPAGAPPGGQRDFFALARAVGWKGSPAGTTPRYGAFVASENWPEGFFPTFRNPQIERLLNWYSNWLETTMSITIQLREWWKAER
jgi:hypothetical protein